jgi:Flp pilus assembly protein TadD
MSPEGVDPVKRLRTVLSCLIVAVMMAPTVRAHAAGSPAAAAKAAGAAAAAPGPVDSLQLLEKSVARDSSRFDDLYRLGVLYLDRDKVTEAVRALTRAHVLQPKDHRVCVNLGVALDAAGRASVAQGYYREALQMVPEDSLASCRLASSLYSEGRYAESVGLLQQIIQRSPAAYCAYFTLGVAFADAGIYKDAVRMWRRVVELAPTSPEAVSARESIEVLERYIGR